MASADQWKASVETPHRDGRKGGRLGSTPRISSLVEGDRLGTRTIATNWSVDVVPQKVIRRPQGVMEPMMEKLGVFGQLPLMQNGLPPR